VEDRRYSGGGKPIKSGIGLIIVAIFTYFMSDGDLGQVFDVIVNNQSNNQTSYTKRDKKSDEEAKFVSVVLKDTEDVWHKLFRELGKRYQEPKLVLFSGSTKSACGIANRVSGPFYCPADYRVYLDLEFFQKMETTLNASGDFAKAYVIAHEIGHHIQNLLGILKKMNSKRKYLSKVESNKILVQVELQADCFAGIWANYAQKMKNILEKGDIDEALNTASSVGDDSLQKKSRGYVIPDSFTHGTSAQRVKWFKIGFESGDINRCNTFVFRDRYKKKSYEIIKDDEEELFRERERMR